MKTGRFVGQQDVLRGAPEQALCGARLPLVRLPCHPLTNPRRAGRTIRSTTRDLMHCCARNIACALWLTEKGCYRRLTTGRRALTQKFLPRLPDFLEALYSLKFAGLRPDQTAAW